jgi:F-type H+-transporting ATPase subunit epsilon
MADSFLIEIATPERLLASEQAVRAQIPGKEGYLGVLPDHAPLLSELGIGALTYATPDGKNYAMAIKQGYVEILDNHVRVLTDQAERGQEIDAAQAEKDLREAQAAYVNPALAMDIASWLIAAKHAQARLDAARKAAAGED